MLINFFLKDSNPNKENRNSKMPIIYGIIGSSIFYSIPIADVRNESNAVIGAGTKQAVRDYIALELAK